jgi:hypothetical protein
VAPDFGPDASNVAYDSASQGRGRSADYDPLMADDPRPIELVLITSVA